MNLVKGEGTVFPKAGKSFDPVLIPKAIQDAGFTAADVALAIDGTLVDKGGSLELVVPNLKYGFVLSGGAKAEELKSKGDLLGQRLRVIGKLHLPTLDKPQLTIDDWMLLNRP